MTDTSEGAFASERGISFGSRDTAAFPTSDSHSDTDLKNPLEDLRQTIETAILPRLMLVHTDPATLITEKTQRADQIETNSVERFVTAIIDQSATSGQEMIDHFVRNGMAMECIYLQLLAPAAQRMGVLWEDDIRSFTDVTVGLCRLHEILRNNRLSAPHQYALPTPETPSILLATACGDQHVFGVIMVAEFFRQAGWQVTCEPAATTRELARIAALHNYDVIGLSIARSYRATEVSEVIQKLRNTSRNPDVQIMLGGSLIARDARFADKVGADLAVTSGQHAPDAAMNLLAHARVGC